MPPNYFICHLLVLHSNNIKFLIGQQRLKLGTTELVWHFCLLYGDPIFIPTSRGGIYNTGWKTNHYVPLRGDRMLRSVYPELQCLQCDQTLAVSGQHWPDMSDHDFSSLEPYWKRPDAGSQRPITWSSSVRSHRTISPQSNELTGLCASVWWHRSQRLVSIWPSIHFQLSIIREWSLLH